MGMAETQPVTASRSLNGTAGLLMESLNSANPMEAISCDQTDLNERRRLGFWSEGDDHLTEEEFAEAEALLDSNCRH
jgi:hypothetical protein